MATSPWADHHPPEPAPERSAGPRNPDVVPLFPVTSFTPGSTCPHCGTLPADSPFVCMVCHKGGERVEARIDAVRRHERTLKINQPVDPDDGAPATIKFQARGKGKGKPKGGAA